MKHLATFISLFILAFAVSAQTRYVLPTAGTTIVSLPHTNEKPSITAPSWCDVEVTNGVEVETNRPLSIVVIQFSSTTSYRTGTVTVKFPSQTVSVEVHQAAPFSFTSNGASLLTHDFKPDDIRKVWLVPEDGEVLPDLVYSSKDDGTLIKLPSITATGNLFIQTATGLYAVRL